MIEIVLCLRKLIFLNLYKPCLPFKISLTEEETNCLILSLLLFCRVLVFRLYVAARLIFDNNKILTLLILATLTTYFFEHYPG